MGILLSKLETSTVFGILEILSPAIGCQGQTGSQHNSHTNLHHTGYEKLMNRSLGIEEE